MYSLRRINLFISIFFIPLHFPPTPTHWSYSRWNIFEWFLITPHKYGIQVYHSCVALSKSNAADGLSRCILLTFRLPTPTTSLSIRRAHVMLSLSSTGRALRTKPNDSIRFDWVGGLPGVEHKVGLCIYSMNICTIIYTNINNNNNLGNK